MAGHRQNISINLPNPSDANFCIFCSVKTYLTPTEREGRGCILYKVVPVEGSESANAGDYFINDLCQIEIRLQNELTLINIQKTF